MKARLAHPGLVKNEDLAECGDAATILFIGMICYADKKGIVEDRPDRIRAECAPYKKTAVVTRLLNKLEEKGFVKRYEWNGKKLIQILKFDKYQSPHYNEKPSEFMSFFEVSRAKNGSQNNTDSTELQVITGNSTELPALSVVVPVVDPVPVVKPGVRPNEDSQAEDPTPLEPTNNVLTAFPVESIINAYKKRSGSRDDTNGWDDVYRKRLKSSAKDLLRYFRGDLKKAIDCLHGVADWAESNSLEWRLDTIVKDAALWSSGKLRFGGENGEVIGRGDANKYARFK